MSGEHAKIENSGKFSLRCLAEQVLGAEKSKWLGAFFAWLVDYRHGLTDHAFEIPISQGDVPRRQADTTRKHNSALFGLIDRVFGQSSVGTGADQIRSVLIQSGIETPDSITPSQDFQRSQCELAGPPLSSVSRIEVIGESGPRRGGQNSRRGQEDSVNN